MIGELAERKRRGAPPLRVPGTDASGPRKHALPVGALRRLVCRRGCDDAGPTVVQAPARPVPAPGAGQTTLRPTFPIGSLHARTGEGSGVASCSDDRRIDCVKHGSGQSCGSPVLRTRRLFHSVDRQGWSRGEGTSTDHSTEPPAGAGGRIVHRRPCSSRRFRRLASAAARLVSERCRANQGGSRSGAAGARDTRTEEPTRFSRSFRFRAWSSSKVARRSRISWNFRRPRRSSRHRPRSACGGPSWGRCQRSGTPVVCGSRRRKTLSSRSSGEGIDRYPSRSCPAWHGGWRPIRRGLWTRRSPVGALPHRAAELPRQRGHGHQDPHHFTTARSCCRPTVGASRWPTAATSGPCRPRRPPTDRRRPRASSARKAGDPASRTNSRIGSCSGPRIHRSKGSVNPRFGPSCRRPTASWSNALPGRFRIDEGVAKAAATTRSSSSGTRTSSECAMDMTSVSRSSWLRM